MVELQVVVVVVVVVVAVVVMVVAAVVRQPFLDQHALQLVDRRRELSWQHVDHLESNLE